MHNHASCVRAARATVIALAVSLSASARAAADSAIDAPRYSHAGLKAAIGLGTVHTTSKLKLNDAATLDLRIGYGFDQNLSLWIAASGSEHKRDQEGSEPVRKTAAGGVALALQYRFLPTDRVQPYGMIGLGSYSLEETDSHNARTGAGLVAGFGADWFVSPHLGFGAELAYRSVTYDRERIGRKGDFKKASRSLDGDAVALVMSVTVQ